MYLGIGGRIDLTPKSVVWERNKGAQFEPPEKRNVTIIPYDKILSVEVKDASRAMRGIFRITAYDADGKLQDYAILFEYEARLKIADLMLEIQHRIPARSDDR